MTDSSKTKAAKTGIKLENQISDVDLDKVTGGGRKAGETPKEVFIIKTPTK